MVQKVLLFDVNETLLDLGPVKQRVADILGDPQAPELWFTSMLQYSLVTTVSGQYMSFSDIGVAVMQMLSRSRNLNLNEKDAKAAISLMLTLPAHQNVQPALRRLRDAGWRMATLTNSSQDAVKAQIGTAGLSEFFERQLSVQSVGKFKPHPEVYQWAAREMKVEPADCMLVAAHGWDVAGAKWAGLKAAFISRGGQQKLPLAPTPDLDVSDLGSLATALGS